MADRLRIVSDAGQSLRINVDTGFVTTDTNLNPGTPLVVAVGYRAASRGRARHAAAWTSISRRRQPAAAEPAETMASSRRSVCSIRRSRSATPQGVRHRAAATTAAASRHSAAHWLCAIDVVQGEPQDQGCVLQLAYRCRYPPDSRTWRFAEGQSTAVAGETAWPRPSKPRHFLSQSQKSC